MMAILAAMAFSFSQVQFQHLWFDFHTLILSHILTFHHIHSADSNVSFFYICCKHRLQALYTSLMTVSTEFVPNQLHFWGEPERAPRQGAEWCISHIHILSVVRCSVMQVDSFNPKHCTRQVQVRMEYRKEHLVKVSTCGTLQSPISEFQFYFHCFRLQILLNLDTQSSSKRALKPALEQRSEKVKGERLYYRHAAQTASERQTTLQKKV